MGGGEEKNKKEKNNYFFSQIKKTQKTPTIKTHLAFHMSPKIDTPKKTQQVISVIRTSRQGLKIAQVASPHWCIYFKLRAVVGHSWEWQKDKSHWTKLPRVIKPDLDTMMPTYITSPKTQPRGQHPVVEPDTFT